jgi:hypothetical protein
VIDCVRFARIRPPPVLKRLQHYLQRFLQMPPGLPTLHHDDPSRGAVRGPLQRLPPLGPASVSDSATLRPKDTPIALDQRTRHLDESKSLARTNYALESGSVLRARSPS